MTSQARVRAFAAAASRSARVCAVLAVIALTGASLTACAASAEEAAPTPTATSTPTPVSVVDTSSISTMIDSPVEAPTLTVIGEVESLSGETAVQVSYVSGGVTVTGVVRTPQGPGPFPAVVVVHGSVDPEAYETGRDLLPEQRALLEAGYLVFAPDLRGFADSDPADSENSITIDPGFGWDLVLDWGMAWDVVNALRLVRSGQVADVDTTRVGLLGHSLGGLLALDAAVIAPGESDMIVTLAAASSNFADLITKELSADSEAFARLSESVGTPEENPEYWAAISPATFVDRATEPLLLIHGGADDATMPEWSQRTAEVWKQAGLPSEAIIIDGTGHLFPGARSEVDSIVVGAFDQALGG
jgi:dipeptidyl aminopeptidase/acylaminoacyl peptidase